MPTNIDLLKRTLHVLKPHLTEVGLQNYRIEDAVDVLQISKTKFYDFFDDLNGLFELLLFDELRRFYLNIQQDKEISSLKEDFLPIILTKRRNYIKGSELLKQYFSNIRKKPVRLNKLKIKVTEIEKEFLAPIFTKIQYPW